MVRDLYCYKRHWRSFWKKRCRYGSILLFKCQSASSYSQTKLELRALSAFGRTGILLKIDWKNGCYFGHQKQSIPLVKFNFFLLLLFPPLRPFHLHLHPQKSACTLCLPKSNSSLQPCRRLCCFSLSFQGLHFPGLWQVRKGWSH